MKKLGTSLKVIGSKFVDLFLELSFHLNPQSLLIAIASVVSVAFFKLMKIPKRVCIRFEEGMTEYEMDEFLEDDTLCNVSDEDLRAVLRDPRRISWPDDAVVDLRLMPILDEYRALICHAIEIEFRIRQEQDDEDLAA